MDFSERLRVRLGAAVVENRLDGGHSPKFEVPALARRRARGRRRSAVATGSAPEKAVFELSTGFCATGTGILVAAIIAGLLMGFHRAELLRLYGQTL